MSIVKRAKTRQTECTVTDVATRSFTPTPSISDLLQELEGLRARLAEAGTSFGRAGDSLQVGALAAEVKRLCLESSRSDDPAEVAALLAGARRHLDALRALLGSS